ncbi:MAG TPA: DUF3303 family protein [Dehalococcoidia bacterium]|nr:DUF3303 family protein [Dehalococcoidia bacterium]
MPLFLIEHHHTAETCPRQNPDMVRALRSHVSDENAERMGLKLLSDWVNELNHEVFIVVDTDSFAKAESFAAPFGMNGSVEVKLGQTCEEVAKECLGE